MLGANGYAFGQAANLVHRNHSLELLEPSVTKNRNFS